MNAGPARIPQHHTTLDYCRELGVPIEVFANQNADGWFYNESGNGVVGPLADKRIRHRTAKADYFGYVSELLAKAISQGALDADLRPEDAERMVDFLRGFGALGPGDALRGRSEPRLHRPARGRPRGGHGRWSAAVRVGPAGQPARLLLPVRGDVGPGDAHVPAGRRHGPHPVRAGRGRRRPDPVRPGGSLDHGPRRGCGSRRHRRQERAGDHRRLLHLHPAATRPRHDPDEPAVRDPGRHRGAQAAVGGEDGPRIQAPLLGGGRGHLRRHHRHEHGPADDLVPLVRLPRRARRAHRLLQLLRRCRPVWRHDARRTASSGRSSRAARSTATPTSTSSSGRSRSTGRARSTAAAAGSSGQTAPARPATRCTGACSSRRAGSISRATT